MRKLRRLDDTYGFPGFRPSATVRGVFGDPKVRILRLQRRGKKPSVALVDVFIGPSTITRCAGYGTSPVETHGSTWR